MNKPQEVPKLAPKPSQQVIDILESALEDAKSGELKQLLLVGDYQDLVVQSAWSDITDNRMRLIGELEQLKFHLMSAELEYKIIGR